MKKLRRYYLGLIFILLLTMGAFFYFNSKKISSCPGEGCTIEWYPKKILEEALKKNDPNICNNTTGGHMQDIAVNKEDSATICKADYAIKKKDVSLCLSLRERSSYQNILRDRCLLGLAINLKRPDLCNLMTKTKPDSVVEQCRKDAQDWF